MIRFVPRGDRRLSAQHQTEDRFEDADILHAVEHARYAADDGDDPDKSLYLGPDRAARLLEVVVVVRDDGTEVAIHAMKMRPNYETLLREARRDHD